MADQQRTCRNCKYRKKNEDNKTITNSSRSCVYCSVGIKNVVSVSDVCSFHRFDGESERTLPEIVSLIKEDPVGVTESVTGNTFNCMQRAAIKKVVGSIK